MLFSLLRTLVFIGIVAGLIYGVNVLVTEGSDLRVALAGYELNLSPVAAVVAGLLLLLVMWLVLQLIQFVFSLLRWLIADETAPISQIFRRRSERRGFQALAEAMTALAAGEGQVARRKAARAEGLLRRPDLTNLIRAQAAEMSNDRTGATEAYKDLLDDERTRFVGIRGLMKQRIAEGDTETAMKLAEKAFALKPRHIETTDTLLQLQAQHANWAGARRTLTAKRRNNEIPADLYKRREAVLYLANAKAHQAAGETGLAQEEAIRAKDLAPNLVPAAVMAARAYIAKDMRGNAEKTLRTAWAKNPHPELAAAYAEIEPEETPEARIKRFEKLTRQNPTHPETKLLLAELEIAAENFPGARKALGDLVDRMPTTRTMTLMAAIERGEGSDDSTVKAWLAKALTVSRGPQWVCENCGHIQADWQPLCGNCEAFDTLAWKDTPAPEALQDTQAGMLPLIVGALEDRGGTNGASAKVGPDEGEIIDQPAATGAHANGAAGTARAN